MLNLHNMGQLGPNLGKYYSKKEIAKNREKQPTSIVINTKIPIKTLEKAR